MRTIEVKVFSFEELSDEAKQKAIDNWRNSDVDFPWSSENRDTLEEFCKIFPVRADDWSYDAYSHDVNFTFTGEDDVRELRGVRLATYIYNNYWFDITSPKTYWLKNYVPSKSRKSRIQRENNCSLTGYYLDEYILAPVYEFLKAPRDIDFFDLMDLCFYEWGKGCMTDVEYQNSDEYIKETIEANDYEFTEEGEMY